jgi:hypothetical protein
MVNNEDLVGFQPELYYIYAAVAGNANYSCIFLANRRGEGLLFLKSEQKEKKTT